MKFLLGNPAVPNRVEVRILAAPPYSISPMAEAVGLDPTQWRFKSSPRYQGRLAEDGNARDC